MLNQRGGYTLSGFSKAGFSACSRWKDCSMGRLTCALDELDSEAKNYCRCFQRHHQAPFDIVGSKRITFSKLGEEYHAIYRGGTNSLNSNLKVGDIYILQSATYIPNEISQVYTLKGAFLGQYYIKEFQLSHPRDFSTEENNKTQAVLKIDLQEYSQLSLF